MNKAIAVVLTIFIMLLAGQAVIAQPLELPSIDISIGDGEEGINLVLGLQLLLLLTILTLAPSIIIMLTSFTRIIIVLSLLRSALATQRMPPNQILIGLTIFLTLFVMSPVFTAINENALQPYLEGELDEETALSLAMEPLRTFMFANTTERDLALFVELSGADRPETPADITNFVLIPSFIISELKKAFQIGFLIYIPFIMIDMIVASVLMSMGMMMLPPVMISLPFKILLFVMVDGWYLLIRSLVATFN